MTSKLAVELCIFGGLTSIVTLLTLTHFLGIVPFISSKVRTGDPIRNLPLRTPPKGSLRERYQNPHTSLLSYFVGGKQGKLNNEKAFTLVLLNTRNMPNKRLKSTEARCIPNLIFVGCAWGASYIAIVGFFHTANTLPIGTREGAPHARQGGVGGHMWVKKW